MDWALPPGIQDMPEWGGPTIPLYSLADHASVIVAWAKRIGDGCEKAVVTVIEWVRKLLGDALKARHLSSVFANEVQQLVTDGREDLKSHARNLETNWDGASAKAVLGYLGEIATSSDTTANAVTAMVNCLDKFLGTITDVYNGVLGFIASCANTIMNLTGSILGSLSGGSGEAGKASSSGEVAAAGEAGLIAKAAGAVGGIVKDVLKALAEFITNVYALLQKAFTASAEFQAAVHAAANTASQQLYPGALIASDVAVGTDGGRWSPRRVEPQPK